MAESAQNQKQITILLAVIAVLLVGAIAVIMWQNSNGVPEPTQTSADQLAAQPAEQAPGTQQPAPATPAAGADFDPATAPVVPGEQTPEEFVNEYYQLCQDGDYAAAYVMLPTATQAYYGDSAGFQSTLEGYGITGFAVQPQAENGDQVTVVGAQQAQGMDFPYTWTFVKGDDGSWLVASRDMGAQ